MPRYVKPSENRWLHPTYRKAYCFNRNGFVHTCVNSHRQATSIEWLPKNKRAAMEILRKRVDKWFYPTSDVSDSRELTIEHLLERFYRDKITKLDKETQKHYMVIYKQFFTTNFYLEEVDKIRAHVYGILQGLDLAQNTVWKRMQRMRKIFAYAIELEWMTRNPITKSMVPNYEHKAVEICSEEVIHEVINYFKTRNYAMSLMIEFAYLTAMRIQEIVDLNWSDIHLDKGYFVIHGKGDRDRIFPVKYFPRAIEILEESKSLGNSKFVTWTIQQYPQRFLKEGLVKMSSEFKKEYPRITFHIIRKSAINKWRKLGIDPEARNAMSGHTRVVETQFYLADPDINFFEHKLTALE